MATNSTDRPKVLIALGGGGYGLQAALLARSLKDRAELSYMTGQFGQRPGIGGIPDGPHFCVPSFKTVSKGTRLKDLGYAGAIAWKSAKFILNEKPGTIVVIAMRQGLVLLAVGRLMGCKTIYVESVTRVKTPSLTLHLCQRMRLAHHIFVQWPQLAEHVPGVSYEGRVI